MSDWDMLLRIVRIYFLLGLSASAVMLLLVMFLPRDDSRFWD